jgi:SAM-dependent methyltransferase
MSGAGFVDAAQTWNQRFAGEEYLFGREPNAYLKAQAARLRPGLRALCVADGEGRNSVWLAGQGLQVDAFDVAEVGVAKARRLAQEAGVSVHYELADADGFAWPEARYDVLAAIFIQFADPALRSRMFARFVAALKPGGLLILQGYTPRQLQFKTGGPPEVSHLYTQDLLREAFGGLQIEELTEYDAELSEGSRHRGTSALLGLVARKP